MTEIVLKLFAFALLVAFLGILLIWVPRVDLGLVLALTVVLAGIDFFVIRPKG